jgi:hypothetical protein
MPQAGKHPDFRPQGKRGGRPEIVGVQLDNSLSEQSAIRMVIDKLRTGVGGVQFQKSRIHSSRPNRSGDPYMVLRTSLITAVP